MEKILISRPAWLLKLLCIFLLCVLVVAYLDIGLPSNLSWSFNSAKFVVCVILLYGTTIAIAAWRLSFVHPVYFDEKCVSWGKGEKENDVEFSAIEGILVYAGNERSSVRIKYNTRDGRAKKIWFVLLADKNDTFGKLRELGRRIQKQKPDFKIVDKGWIESVSD